MKKFILILPLCFLIFNGCGSTLKQQWYDFTAYYNTFYNANQYFNEGLERNLAQRPGINPEELLRIHPKPSSAGATEFGIAIEKSADILRNHSRSKYVDNAIELIGASYYYRQEYFAALEKFQELYANTDNPDMRIRATIWEGRTYLELELYSEGVRFMESRIEEIDSWSSSKLAETRVVLAQLFAFQGTYYRAGDQLMMALEQLDDRELRSRAYFHYGQLMERLGNLEQAAFAFSEVSALRPQFDLEYHAKLGEIRVLRNQGYSDQALNRLRSMGRDNKFYDYRLELRFEQAQAERARGNPGDAEDLYNQIIHSRTISPDRPLLARSYYGIADLYRNDFQDYRIAAAYYDSAAAVRADRDRLPASWDADNLSRIYGEFAAVKEQIITLDSLLTLARLPEDKFQQRIEEIEQQLQEERDALRASREDREAGAVYIDPDVDLEETTEIGRHGFLNVQHRAMVQQSSMQFRSVWGDRPLADNWRRQQAVIGSREEFTEQRAVYEPGEELPAGGGEPETGRQIDLSVIPFQPSQQDSVEALIHQNYYRLGTVFLTNLEMPDSAKVYFNRVIEEGPDMPLKASSMYALAEIYLEESDRDKAEKWAERLAIEFPDSDLTSRILRRMGYTPSATETEPAELREQIGEADETGERDGIEEAVYGLETDPEEETNGLLRAWPEERFTGLSSIEIAAELSRLAAETEDRQEAAFKLNRAAELLITSAVDEPEYRDKQEKWQFVEPRLAETTEFRLLLDGDIQSMQVSGEIAEMLGLEVGESLDRTHLLSIYPYSGEKWSMARELLMELEESYGNTRPGRRASLLLEELAAYREMYGDPEP